jgi:hypothetical protein
LNSRIGKTPSKVRANFDLTYKLLPRSSSDR